MSDFKRINDIIYRVGDGKYIMPKPTVVGEYSEYSECWCTPENTPAHAYRIESMDNAYGDGVRRKSWKTVRTEHSTVKILYCGGCGRGSKADHRTRYSEDHQIVTKTTMEEIFTHGLNNMTWFGIIVILGMCFVMGLIPYFMLN